MPPRASTRNKKAAAPISTTSTAAAPVTPPPAPKKAPASKRKAPTSKRSRAQVDDDEEDEEEEVKAKPVSKKKKVAKDDDEDKALPEKLVTVIKRGAAPVDPNSQYVQTHQVLSYDGEVWDGMLNQTNINKNNNKFYVLQLLHTIGNNSSCLLFLRWGRVGENGQSQTKGPWSTTQAINEFKKQFRSKTGISWEMRKDVVANTPRAGKYTWLERDFEEDEKDKEEGSSGSKGKEKEEEKPIPDSKLDSSIQSLCSLIFSTSLMDAALSSMNYDANKLPLGKLSKQTILNGFAALKELSEVLETPAKATQYGGLAAACAELSGRYYSIIPHNFGRNKPISIDSMPKLKKELELVDALGDMEIATKLLASKTTLDEDGNPLNPVDAHFRSLNLETMDPVAFGSKEFEGLATYAKDSHGSTHSYYKVNVEAAFRVTRRGEYDNWSKGGFEKYTGGERLLLWHGSRSTNFAGILSQGLRIAPPEAPVNGYMFGKGVYFADMMSKSANYCYANSSNNIGILLLCDVAVKPLYELNNASYNACAECKNAGKLATKGIGRTQPVDWQDASVALENEELKGVMMPKGAAQSVNPPGAYLQYNEYIVYDTSQIRVKYLLMVKMTY
ncbi:PARP-domain-containing protein [Schizopora paradoxa]|uniref:Poly [ADP-ribose] polymerase n=1 Tax=Schizopora paradoxa TaxID=27342 RepID=A0A0H2SF87_9AGAM|nr:PARP-domain-containing protein [Schizopora paradoxa]